LTDDGGGEKECVVTLRVGGWDRKKSGRTKAARPDRIIIAVHGYQNWAYRGLRRETNS
jgi:hypothetical protein